jgi:hypothetical protein
LSARRFAPLSSRLAGGLSASQRGFAHSNAEMLTSRPAKPGGLLT